MQTRAEDPEAQDYYAKGYWRREDFWQDFAAQVDRQPDKLALVCGDTQMTFGELRHAAVALSARMGAAGVASGDLVGLSGRHSIEAVVALMACFHRGVVLAPVPPMFSEQQIGALMVQNHARALIGFGSDASLDKARALEATVPLVLTVAPEDITALLAEPADSAHAPVDADAMAVVLLSSGTTSAPKGIVHSINTIRYATEQVLARWGLTRDDVLLVLTEFGFVGGLVFGYLPAMRSGATAVLLPKWDPADAVRLIERYGCTYTLMMPTHGTDLLYCAEADTHDISSLRVLVSAGMSTERRIAMRERFSLPPLGDYGLSEVPGNCAPAPDAPWEKIVSTDGNPFDGTDVRVLDAEDAPVPAGTQGAVVINGPSRFLGFLNNDQLTAESLTEWGGYRTGDVGTLDADGYFTYVGRDKDIIRRGGLTIVPTEVEAVLLKHAAVREVALVGFDDARLGERACAALITQPGVEAPTLEQLQEHLEANGVGRYTWPERVEHFTEFPRTPSLKPVKREIRSEVAARIAREKESTSGALTGGTA